MMAAIGLNRTRNANGDDAVDNPADNVALTSAVQRAANSISGGTEETSSAEGLLPNEVSGLRCRTLLGESRSKYICLGAPIPTGTLSLSSGSLALRSD